jgi:FkbM family methyltransferase
MISRTAFEFMRAVVQPGDAVIDAGAHLGSFTLALAAARCRVLAVEASARNVDLLRASVAFNGFSEVRVVHAAAAAAEGSLSFLADGAWGWVAAPGEPFTEYTPAVRLDDLVDLLQWERVALVKIDVEGSELSVVRGLSRLLARDDAPALYYESNAHTLGHAGVQPGEVVAALEAFGYRSYLATPGGLRRVRPDQPQRDLVVDHLAVKGPLPLLPNTHIDEGTAGE